MSPTVSNRIGFGFLNIGHAYDHLFMLLFPAAALHMEGQFDQPWGELLVLSIPGFAAFAISELADWLVYSFTKRPFAQRILLSSVLATPIDTVVFLGIMGWLSAPAVLAMTASKLVGALIVWYLVRNRMEVENPA